MLQHRLRRNPHRLNLGAIGLRLPGAIGESSNPEAVGNLRQELDLWTGIIHSRWLVAKAPAEVTTCCHPRRDAVSVRIESPLCADGMIGVELAFPYGSPETSASDWAAGALHRSELRNTGPRQAVIVRTLDDTRYTCTVHLADGATLRREDDHLFVVTSGVGSAALSFVVEFSPHPAPTDPLDSREVEGASAWHWERFWEEGGCIELAGSSDARAFELERRVVLSQYLTAIQCAGSLPPQETGLTCNSWHGKFHLEMHYWHAAHFPLWGRAPLLERSMGWYASVLYSAQRTARSQGYAGARWPKMVGPEGRESPSTINPLIIWQQPHPIMLAELLYRARPDKNALERYADIVFESAQFMASFVREDRAGRRFVLRPPIVPAQENHDPRLVWNPAFELEYWDFGLRTALLWRSRLGLPAVESWEKVIVGLSRLPVAEGLYVAWEGCPEMWGAHAADHPSMLYCLGMLPGRKVDRGVMNQTLDAVLAHWRFPEAWGWDFPAMAMTAARLGRRDDAVGLLLMDSPKNTYRANGHNAQEPRADLPVYLPGNGALLIAVAAMAAGWDGHEQAPATPAGSGAPGFPANGTWRVEREGLLPTP